MSHVTCHVSGVMCHLSGVTWQVSGLTFFSSYFFQTKWLSQSVEGLLSTGHTSSSVKPDVVVKCCVSYCILGQELGLDGNKFMDIP